MNLELPRQGLVTWTGGNVSGRDPEAGLRGDQAERRALRAADARRTWWWSTSTARSSRARSSRRSDTATPPVHLPPPAGRRRRGPYPLHLRHQLRRCRARPIPVYLTAMADEFGRRDPVGAYCADRRRTDRPGDRRAHRRLASHPDEEPRRVHHRQERRSRRQGRRDDRGRGQNGAYRAAARAGRATPRRRSRRASTASTRRLRPAPRNATHQGGATMQRSEAVRSLVRHRQPAPVRRRRRCGRSRTIRDRSRQALDDGDTIPVGSSSSRWSPRPRRSAACAWKPTPPTTASDLIAWMHTFSPAKMWIAGLTRAAEATCPSAHPVQPRDPVGRDRHGLHEPQPVGAWRPRVRLHRQPAAAEAQGGRRPLAGCRRPRAARRVDARRLRLARCAGAQGRPLRRQHARRGRDRGRQGRGAGAARLSRQRLRRRRPGRSRSTPRPTPKSTSWWPNTRTHTTCRRAAAHGRRSGTNRCATPPESSSACAVSSTSGGFKAFTDTFEDLHGLKQLPGIAAQRLMADGYGFGAEGDWKTAALVRR